MRLRSLWPRHHRKAHNLPPELPPLTRAAKRALLAGRACCEAGKIDEGRKTLIEAFHSDPRIALHPWGMMPHLASETRANVKARLDQRLVDWRKPDEDHAPVRAAAALTHKPKLKEWAQENGFATPRVIGEYSSLAAVDWASLPPGFVIKPINASSNQGVVVVLDGYDHIGRSAIGPDLPAYVASRYTEDRQTKSAVLIEEAVTDCAAAHDSTIKIPRDFKVFAVAGKAVFTRVHDRNANTGKRSLISYDREGFILPATQKLWTASANVPAPPGYAKLIAEVERASRMLPWLLRFDFYLAPEGPLLGEITTYPNAGFGYTQISRRTLLQMWEIHPD